MLAIPAVRGGGREALWEAALVFWARDGGDLGLGSDSGVGEKWPDEGLSLEVLLLIGCGVEGGQEKERSPWWPLGSLLEKLVVTGLGLHQVQGTSRWWGHYKDSH